MHGARESLVARSNSGLQSHHVKVQTFARYYALQKVRETVLGSSSQHDSQGILLFHAELDQLDNLLIPPALPGSLFLSFDTVASCRENARVVPPAAIDEDFGRRKIAKGVPIPELGIREGGLEQGIVEVVDVNSLDRFNG